MQCQAINPDTGRLVCRIATSCGSLAPSSGAPSESEVERVLGIPKAGGLTRPICLKGAPCFPGQYRERHRSGKNRGGVLFRDSCVGSGGFLIPSKS
ncbi:hypothetical protein Nepgr_025078 [Nepenthes gracilis]|uniref:Uncharacterized protein n=1 Tax=Nepenthes gracilis TaxID=150966 RepID=A0AAD3Y0Q4_NEPGR|nr:hypothetical protein Nepgr_025078 [Nepenthes gracilis]